MAVVADGEGLIIIVVVAIELVEHSTVGKDSRFVDTVGTKECTVAHDVASGVWKTGSIEKHKLLLVKKSFFDGSYHFMYL